MSRGIRVQVQTQQPQQSQYPPPPPPEPSYQPPSQEPQPRATKPPRLSSVKRALPGIILIVILVILLALFFVPFIDSETTKYEIVDFRKDNGFGVCQLTIRDLGVGGVYFVKFTIYDHFGRDVDTDQVYIAPNEVQTLLSNGHFEIHFCDCEINAPKTTEKKSVFQTLTGL
jgi:hypothetical protein